MHKRNQTEPIMEEIDLTLTKLMKAHACHLIKVIFVLYLILTSLPVSAKHRLFSHKYIPPYAGIVIDAKTNQILYQNNANLKLRPASLTKIMTLLMVFEALSRGEIRLYDRMYISRYAASMAPSKLGLKVGESITIRDAIYAVVTKSCNDIAVAFAERLAGDEKSFAHKMTTRAHQLGMINTTFANTSGLPHRNQWSTAKDMAILARHVIMTYPHYYQFYATKSYNYDGQILRNHNHLMNTYIGMDGIKSGYIDASGFNLVASAVRDHRRLIGVVFGGKTAKSRNTQMANLLNAGFLKLKMQVKLNSPRSAKTATAYKSSIQRNRVQPSFNGL